MKQAPEVENYYDEDHKLYNRSTFFLSAITNKLVHAASSLLRRKYGIGIVEWRCVAMLVEHPGINASRICDISGMNKSLVSQALAKLETLGFVMTPEEARYQKPKPIELTEAGRVLYDTHITVVENAEKEITQGLSAQEHDELIRMLRLIYRNVTNLDW